MSEDVDTYEDDVDQYLKRCISTVGSLYKLTSATDLANDDLRDEYLSTVENAIGDLVVARLRVSGRVAARIILAPGMDAQSRRDSVDHLAAINHVLKFYEQDPVDL